MAALCAMPALVVSGQQADRVSLDTVLDRAGWYLESFIDEFENVVAEEIYTQDASAPLQTFAPTGRGAAAQLQMSAADTVRARHRDLRSDFLLAKSPDTTALMPFRDVLEVDGACPDPRSAQARLAKLFSAARRDSMDRQAAHAFARKARATTWATCCSTSPATRSSRLGVLQQTLPAALPRLARQGRRVDTAFPAPPSSR